MGTLFSCMSSMAATARSAAAAVGSTVANGATVVAGTAALSVVAFACKGTCAGGVAREILRLTVEEIRNQLQERVAALKLHIVKAKILKCVKEDNYNMVHVGLYDSSDVLRHEEEFRPKELGSDVYEGKVITLAS